MVVLGVILMIVGVLAILAGVAGGIAAMVRDLRRPQPRREGLGDPLDALEGVVKALTEFLGALVKAPTWLALVVLGLVLVAYGGVLVGGG